MPTRSPSLSLCHLQVFTQLKDPSLTFFTIVLLRADDRLLQLVQSCSAARLLGTAFLEYLAQALLSQATVV